MAVTGGLSASALFGTRWIDADAPAELFRVNGKPVPGIVIHRDELHPDEICDVSGIASTTPARTAFDLGRRNGLLRAVIRVDALAHQTGVTAKEIATLIPRHRGVRGLVQLRDVIELMDGGAESPQETRTRLVLIKAGLPKPRTQIRVHPYRLDMGYDEFKVGVEYDGEQHWTDPVQRAKDIDRLADLAALGWRIIRVSAEILRNRPQVIVSRTCQALRAAGAEWPVVTRILGDRVK
jgi:very-short-patch-repair endonuclease